jgi:hypothetical protein
MLGPHIDNEKLLASEELTFGWPIVGKLEKFKVQFLVNDRRTTLISAGFEG